jgi:AraC-like DNA-binding protein
VESGSGYLQVDGTVIPLEPGFVYLIPSRLHFGYGCSGMKKLYFHIRVSSLEQRDLLSNIGCIMKLPYEPETLQALLSCYRSTELYGVLQLKMLLLQQICHFAKAYDLPQRPIKTYSEAVRQAISYIQATPTLKLTVKSIAQYLFISESKLRNTFKQETGITIGDYIDQCVFRQAKLLLQSPMSMEQISNQLGFCDQFYFSRRFKQRYGLTPSQHRKLLHTERT